MAITNVDRIEIIGIGIWTDRSNGVTFVSESVGGILHAYSFDGIGETELDSIEDVDTHAGIWASNGFVFVACGTNGLRVYAWDGSFNFLDDATPATGFHVWSDGTYIYFSTTSVLYAYTWNGTTLTQVGSITHGYTGGHLCGEGGYIFMCAYSAGIKAFSFDGSNFTEEDSVDPGGSASRAFALGGKVYLASGTAGLYVYEFDGSFSYVDDVAPADYALGVWVEWGYIYLAANDSSDGLYVYQLIAGVLTFVDSDTSANINYPAITHGDGSYLWMCQYGGDILIYNEYDVPEPPTGGQIILIE